MNTFLTRALTACAAVALLSLPAMADHHKGHGKTIVETAAGNQDFSTLVTAVKAAELVETLNGDGPFTVFAPTNAAFNKLPSGTVDTLLKPENQDKLQNILKYHVVAGKVMAADAVKLSEAEAVNGETFKIEQRDGAVYVDGAKVVKTDLACSNGVIHVIDAVMIPGD